MLFTTFIQTFLRYIFFFFMILLLLYIYFYYIIAPELLIVDESHMPLYERHYEVNSTLELYCLVHNIEMTSSVVLWTHNEHVLNYDAIRGGIR